MKSVASLLRSAEHPADRELSAYACGEANWWERWRLDRHLRSCENCVARVCDYQMDQAAIRENAPEEISPAAWSVLEREMRANILVGVSAGKAVRTPDWVAPPLGWKGMATIGVLSAVVITGWLMRDPRQMVAQILRGQYADVELERTDQGLKMTAGERGIELLDTSGGSTVVTYSKPRAMQASFVDQESGQVTITNVATD